MEEKQDEAQNLKVDPGFGTKSVSRARIFLPNGRYNVVSKVKNYYDAYLFLVGVG